LLIKQGAINIGGLEQLQQVIISNNILTGNILELIANKTLLQIVNAGLSSQSSSLHHLKQLF